MRACAGLAGPNSKCRGPGRAEKSRPADTFITNLIIGVSIFMAYASLISITVTLAMIID